MEPFFVVPYLHVYKKKRHARKHASLNIRCIRLLHNLDDSVTLILVVVQDLDAACVYTSVNQSLLSSLSTTDSQSLVDLL